jgi:hypothetical protein
MWLPHGLAAGVGPAALKPLISICRLADPMDEASACAPLGFNLSRPSKGQLRMDVPGLEPRQRFRVAVKGSAAVKDAFGLPLQVGRGGPGGEGVGGQRCCSAAARPRGRPRRPRRPRPPRLSCARPSLTRPPALPTALTPQPTTTVFWSKDLDAALTGPDVRGGGSPGTGAGGKSSRACRRLPRRAAPGVFTQTRPL